MVSQQLNGFPLAAARTSRGKWVFASRMLTERIFTYVPLRLRQPRSTGKAMARILVTLPQAEVKRQ